jgi:cytochrome c-type biogenesis protein CcmH
MLMFSLAVLLLLAVALIFLLPPVRRARLVGAADPVQANVAIFRERLRELAADRDSGVLTEAQFAEARADLERELLADAAPVPARPQRRPARATAVAVAVLVPILALGLYVELGGWRALQGAERQLPSDPEAQLAFIRDNIGRLEERVRAEPQAMEPRLMLARSYLVLEQADKALAIYADALEQIGPEPPLLADYAEALAQEQGRFTAHARELLARALEQSPAFPKALWLAGLAAAQAGDAAQARVYWQRLLATLPPESETAAQLRQLLGAPADAAAAAGAAKVTVAVSLAPELAARVPADATVFILARPPDGNGAPLAVQRLTVADLPRQLVLDESMAMVPARTLAHFPRVILEARVSLSGQAAPRSGDLLGRTEPIPVTTESPVALRIDQVMR